MSQSEGKNYDFRFLIADNDGALTILLLGSSEKKGCYGTPFTPSAYSPDYSRVPNTSVGRNKRVGRKICRKLIIM